VEIKERLRGGLEELEKGFLSRPKERQCREFVGNTGEEHGKLVIMEVLCLHSEELGTLSLNINTKTICAWGKEDCHHALCMADADTLLWMLWKERSPRRMMSQFGRGRQGQSLLDEVKDKLPFSIQLFPPSLA
jgi:hypothetical protein